MHDLLRSALRRFGVVRLSYNLAAFQTHARVLID